MNTGEDGSRSFEVTIPGDVYEAVWARGVFGLGNVRFGIDSRSVNPIEDALLSGAASAGLLAVRRRSL